MLHNRCYASLNLARGHRCSFLYFKPAATAATVSLAALHAGLQMKLPAAHKVLNTLCITMVLVFIIRNVIWLASHWDDPFPNYGTPPPSPSLVEKRADVTTQQVSKQQQQQVPKHQRQQHQHQRQQKLSKQWKPTMHAPAPAPPHSTSTGSDSMHWAVGAWQSVSSLYHYGPLAA